MICKSCGEEMKRVAGKLYFCDECEELYRVDGDTQKTVKNKEKHLKEIADKLKEYSAAFLSIAEKCGVKLDEGKKKGDDEEEESAFPFLG